MLSTNNVIMGVVVAALVSGAGFGVYINTQSEQTDCDYEIPSAQTNIDGGLYEPGEIVCLEAGLRGRLNIDGIRGTASNPVVVLGLGVHIVSDEWVGIYITDSSHLQISGGDTSCGNKFESTQQDCGIRVTSTSHGIMASNKSAQLELDHIEIYDTIWGIFPNNKNVTDGWIARDVKFRHMYLRKIKKECMYIGSNSAASDPAPFDGIEVSWNLFEDCGWEAVQISQAGGDISIHHNSMHNSGWDENTDPEEGNGGNGQSAILLNSGVGFVRIFNNYIHTSPRALYGAARTENFNNVLINNEQGFTLRRENSSVYNNTIIGSPRDSIYFSSGVDKGEAHNNVVVASSGSYFRDNGSSGIDYESNVTGQTFNEVEIDVDCNPWVNGQLIDGSSSLAPDFDFRDVSRIVPDIGACEYVSVATVVPTSTQAPVIPTEVPLPTDEPPTTLTLTPTATVPKPEPVPTGTIEVSQIFVVTYTIRYDENFMVIDHAQLNKEPGKLELTISGTER